MASASDQRHGVGDDVGEAEPLGDGHERVVQRRLRHRTEQHRADGDAELRGREQQAGAVHRLERHRGALAARVGERLELAAAGRHRGELGTDEEGVGAEQHQRDEHDEPAAHDRSSRSSSAPSASPASPGRRARGAPGRPGGRPCRRPGRSSRRPARCRPRSAPGPGSTSPSRRRSRRPARRGWPRPTRARTSSGRHSPGTVHDPSRSWRPVVCERSCSSLTSPTISSTRSSRVTTPDVPPYSSTTTASCMPPCRSWSSSGSSRSVSGTSTAGTISAETGTSLRRSNGTAMAFLTCTMPSMSSQSAPTTGNRECPVRRASRDEVGRGRGALDRGRPRARRHHVGGGLVGEAEGCRDEPRGAAVEGARLGRASAPATPARPGCGPRRAPPGAGCRAPAGCGWRPR